MACDRPASDPAAEPDPVDTEALLELRFARASAWRRLVALFIDVSIVTAVWHAVEDCVVYPAPEIVFNLGRAGLFVLYFCVIFNPARGVNSAGKALLSIKTVADWALPVRPQGLVIRSAVMAGLILLNWGELLVDISGGRVPMLVVSLAHGAQFALLLTMVLSAITDSWGRSLADRLAHTLVVELEPSLVGRGDDGTERHALQAWIVPTATVLCLAGGLGFSAWGLAMQNGEVQLQRFLEPASQQSDLGSSIEDLVASELNLRVAATVTAGWTRQVGGPRRTTFDIDIELPMVAWNERYRQAVAQVVFGAVTMNETYDECTLVLRSGVLGFSTSWTVAFTVVDGRMQSVSGAVVAP